MSLFDFKYKAGQFAQKIGVTPDVLRDWRRRNVEIGIDTNINGQKKYCDYDVLEAKIAEALRASAFDSIPASFRVARHLAPIVGYRLGLDFSASPRKWFFMEHEWSAASYLLVSGTEDYAYTSDLNHFLKENVMACYMRPVCTIIDVQTMIDQIRDRGVVSARNA